MSKRNSALGLAIFLALSGPGWSREGEVVTGSPSPLGREATSSTRAHTASPSSLGREASSTQAQAPLGREVSTQAQAPSPSPLGREVSTQAQAPSPSPLGREVSTRAQAPSPSPLSGEASSSSLAQAAEAAPSPSPSVERAEEFFKKGDRGAAIGEYRAVVAAQPEHLEAWKRLGQLLSWDGRLVDSLAAYDQALQLSPGNREIRLEKARVLSWKGQLKASIAEFKAVLAEDPQNREALLGLARTYAWDGDFEDALAIYDQMLQTKPDDVEAKLGRAQVLSWDDRLDESLADYQSVLDQDPENLEAALGQARVMAWQGDLDEAVARYEELLVKYPESSEVRAGLGDAKSWQGMDTAAFEQLREAVKLDPTNDDARRSLRALERLHKAEFSPMYTIARDSEANDLQVAGADLSFDADPQTRVKLTYRNFNVANVPQQRHGQADMVVASVNSRLSPEVLVRAHLGYIRLDPSGIPSETKPMGGLNVQYNPHPHHTLNVGYNREVLSETAQLVENGISVDNVDVNYRINMMSNNDLVLGYQRSTFSDANTRNQYNLAFTHTLKKTWPMVKVGYVQKFQEYDRQTFNGYFSPLTFQTGEAIFEVEQRDPDDPWVYFLNAGAGYQKIYGETSQFVYHVTAGVGYQLDDWGLIEISGLTSNSAAASVQGFGYNAGNARMVFRF